MTGSFGQHSGEAGFGSAGQSGFGGPPPGSGGFGGPPPGSGGFGGPPPGSGGFGGPPPGSGGFGGPPPNTGGFGGPPPSTGGFGGPPNFGGPANFGGGIPEAIPTLSRSPLWILWLAIAVPIATLALAFLEGLPWHIAGWAIAVLGSMLLVWFFTVKDLQARLKPFIDQPGLLRTLRIAALATGILIGLFHAYLIADVVARWDVWV